MITCDISIARNFIQDDTYLQARKKQMMLSISSSKRQGLAQSGWVGVIFLQNPMMLN